ncbi:LPXTG cell wall anchor domain-containing protein [Lactobacillaceae bacterium Scapto_B20]
MKKTKIHYRLYMTKPHWAFVAITTGIVALSFQVGASHVAHADDAPQNVDQNAAKLATDKTTASSATSEVQSAATTVNTGFDTVSSASVAINSTYAVHSDRSDVVNASAAALKAFNDARAIKSSTDSLAKTASVANAKVSAATSYSTDVDQSVAVTTDAQTAANQNVDAISSIVNSITSLNATFNTSASATPVSLTTYSVAASSSAIDTVASNIAAYDSYANRAHTVSTTVEFTNGDSVVASQTYYGYPGNDIAYQLDGPAGYSFVSTPNIKGSSVASTATVAILPNGVVTVVKFVENGQLVGQRAYNTKPNTPIDYTADIEQGYHAVNGPIINSGTVSQTYTVNIERGQITTTLQFMHGNDVVATRQFVGGTNSNIYLNGDVPAGYHAVSDAPIYAGYGDQTVQVQLIKDPVATNPGDHDDNGSGADSSANSHAHSKASSAHSHASSHASSASHSASSQSNGKVKYHAVKNASKAKLPQTGESETARNASILGGLMVLLSFGLYGAAKRQRKD